MPIKGRGALSNPESRFTSVRRERFDDGWDLEEESQAPPGTTLHEDPARRVITRNDSPDIPFDQSLNVYRGCSHGCAYCYARPSHVYLDHSPGLDFETHIYFKARAAERLREELARPGYVPKTINLGANTDPYQPDEKHLKLTRGILQVMLECRHPVGIVTKGGLVRRDLDLLSELARDNLVSVAVSLTSLSNDIKRTLEPRTASPATRLKTIRALADAGVPVTALIAPVIPAVTDGELEALCEAAADAGARRANYILLRLPREVKELFVEWLEAHYPERAEHVMSLMRQSHGGRANDPRFGHRMRGSGPYAELIGQRFRSACRRCGLNSQPSVTLDTSKFRPPDLHGQGSLF